jgi:ABC-type Fe3+ transport system permease subunit
MVTMRSEVRKEIIWACFYVALFFVVGGLIGFVSGGGDHFRGGQIEFSTSEWTQIRQEQWGSFWLTGLIAIPCGLGFYGVAFLIRALWWRFKHSD